MTTITPSKNTARNLGVAEALNHLIVKLTNAYKEYWSRADEELLAELNADVNQTFALFESNFNLATSLNASMDAMGVADEKGNPVYTARVPITRGREDIGFENGEFFIIPPPPPVVDETPAEPEPPAE